MTRRLRAAVALAACSLAACSFALPGGGELSVDREREITDQVARQIRAGAPLITDPVLVAYLNELGQSLVREVEPQPFLYRFSIIRDSSLNAFTIGGGHVYVNSGVLAQVGSASELMGVLAHEIAHVRERHIARRSEGQGIATLATLAAVAAVAVGGADPEVMVAAQALNVSLQLRNSRQAESEADREGLAYLVRAGYEPDGMLRFFERIVAASPARGSAELPSYLFTHPAVQERIRDGRSLIARMPPHPPLRSSEPRLAEMQGRLALLLEPTPGGSGLSARSSFARERTDPLLARAQQLRSAGDLDGAQAQLLRAEELEPADPRVPLLRAELAEARMDFDAALPPLRRAFTLDPAVPLVQLRLGEALRRLGRRSEAVFYLEQAAANLRAGSSLQKRAEELLSELPFPPLSRSSLRGAPASLGARFAAGEPVSWEGELSARFAAQTVRVRWLAPDGSLHREETLQGAPARARAARLETTDLLPGDWTLEVWVGEVRAERARFALGAPPRAVPSP